MFLEIEIRLANYALVANLVAILSLIVLLTCIINLVRQILLMVGHIWILVIV